MIQHGVHCEISVMTLGVYSKCHYRNVDFVCICNIQCDLFDCCIFNYKIMPATLANTFLFILQGSALAGLGVVVDFRIHAW